MWITTEKTRSPVYNDKDFSDGWNYRGQSRGTGQQVNFGPLRALKFKWVEKGMVATVGGWPLAGVHWSDRWWWEGGGWRSLVELMSMAVVKQPEAFHVDSLLFSSDFFPPHFFSFFLKKFFFHLFMNLECCSKVFPNYFTIPEVCYSAFNVVYTITIKHSLTENLWQIVNSNRYIRKETAYHRQKSI